MLSDGFAGQHSVSTMTPRHAPLLPSGQKPSISEPCSSLSQPSHPPPIPPQQPSYPHQEAERREQGGVTTPLCAGVDHVHPSPSSAFHPKWVTIHLAGMQMVSLRQCLAALLPGPQGTLAGGGPPTARDDVGLLQAVADESHTQYTRRHLYRTQTSRK